MNNIFIYTETMHPRLAYVTRFIQQFDAENEWICIDSLNDYQSSHGVCINYSSRRIKDHEIFIKFSGWLTFHCQEYKNVPFRNTGEQFQIFPIDEEGFDVFAAIFYVLARIEEYHPFEKDLHQRFPANQSILYKNNVLSIPIVDIWVIQLMQSLELSFGIKFNLKKCKPSWSIGIDVDQFFKFKHKSIIKKTGGLIRSLLKGEMYECIQRIQILLFNKKDPYDSFDQLEQLKINKEQLYFFILSGGQSEHDKNHSLHLKVIKNILMKLNRFSMIGLHPSYAFTQGLSSISLEKNNLEQTLGYSVDMSRQHFLKIRFPETYRTLIAYGIKKDFSLGYPDFPGFRAGSCRPFYWYDIEREEEIDLILIPFVAMDRTYLDYLKYSPETCAYAIKKLFDACMHVGGHFHMIWHNSSYDFEGEWKTWDGLLESLIQYFRIHEN